jgi:hypothetical protein
MDPATVTKKIRYQVPFKGIFHDTDGSWIDEKRGVTGDAWATSDWGFNLVDPACERSTDIYDGLICDGSITVRGVRFTGFKPNSLKGRDIYIVPYDDSIISPKTEDEIKAYELSGDTINGLENTKLPMRTKPFSHWAVPMVTGHKYYLRWGDVLDFEKMTFTIHLNEWNDPLDKDIELEMPFNDVREAITVDGNDGTRIENNTIAVLPTVMGANLVRNDTELMVYPDLMKRLNLVLNGGTPGRSNVALTGWRCIGNNWDGSCGNEDVPDEVTDDTPIRLWSDIASWDDIGRIPIDGDDVVIEPSWRMVYDIPVEEAPRLTSLQINGELTFLDGADRFM